MVPGHEGVDVSVVLLFLGWAVGWNIKNKPLDRLSAGGRRSLAVAGIWMLTVAGWSPIQEDGEIEAILDAAYLRLVFVPIVVIAASMALWRWSGRPGR